MLALLCNVVPIPSESLHTAFDVNGCGKFWDALCFFETLVQTISYGLC